MMLVMNFDVRRRGTLISQVQLNEYTRWLAIAVTEAMHYFIGRGAFAPRDETRYLAVSAAHITHKAIQPACALQKICTSWEPARIPARACLPPWSPVAW